MTKIRIAIPYSSSLGSSFDDWNSLLRDLRDDVPRFEDLPRYPESTLGDIYGLYARIWIIDVDDDLANQLLASAYARTMDLVIQQA